MRYNPKDKEHNARLKKSVEWSLRQMEDFKDIRVEAIKEYCGSYYGGIGAKKWQDGSIPINTLYQFILVYVRNIVSQNPECLIDTKTVPHKPYVKNLEINVNKVCAGMNIVRAFQECVLESLFGMGIAKVGMNEEGNVFVRPVYFDDHIHDMGSYNLSQLNYIGNYYRVPYEFIMESKLFKNNNELSKDNRRRAVDHDLNRAEFISKSSDYPSEYEDTVTLLDLFVKDKKGQNLLVTFPKKGDWEKPLRIVEWEGPETGPYHMLYYNTVPANPMPLAPVNNLMPLHNAIQQLSEKLIKQAKSQKSVLPYEPVDAEAAEAIVKAKDGEAFKAKNAQNVKETRVGGIDQTNFGFLVQLMEIFNEQAGNLRLLGGTSASSDTLGQDQMLARAASGHLADMKDKFYDFSAEIYRDIAWYEVNVPNIERKITKKVNNIIGEITTTYRSNEIRNLDINYELKIDPISTVYKSPEMRLMQLDNYVQSLVPLMPLMQQQGISFNMEGYMRARARYMGMTELEELITFVAPQPADQSQGGGMPSETTRNYVRKGVSGRDTSGQKQDMITQLMGGRLQDAQNQGMGR